MPKCGLLAGMKESCYIYTIREAAPSLDKSSETKILQSKRLLNCLLLCM
ncbi:Uncharacterized protein NEOC95_001013 [Neochlamydia sp. AcF95]|nr:Uncharacterized protein [Neochlamydia sp. AcF95]